MALTQPDLTPAERELLGRLTRQPAVAVTVAGRSCWRMRDAFRAVDSRPLAKLIGAGLAAVDQAGVPRRIVPTRAGRELLAQLGRERRERIRILNLRPLPDDLRIDRPWLRRTGGEAQPA
jgi:hypothetical protein